MRIRFWMTFAIAIVCVAANAQWTDPAVDLPAFHATAPAKSTVQPPILHGAQLTGPNFQRPWQVKVYQDAAKIPKVLYQLPCIAAATGHWATPVCAAALKACMERNATSAQGKVSTPTR